MEIYQLKTFVAVATEGNLTRAAERVFTSPPAVSAQLKALEDEFGVKLFERSARGMAPSAAGELLAAHARRGALEADRVVSDIQALQGLRTGLVRICSSAGFAIEFLPRVMAQFRQQYPGIQFHLRVASPAAVTVAVLNGDADIGLTYSRSAERDIVVQHRQAAPVIAIMRPDPQAGAMRQIVAELMTTSPEANRYFGELITGAAVRHDLGDDDPLVGRLVANLELTVDGASTRL